jgi:hypothetical protein
VPHHLLPSTNQWCLPGQWRILAANDVGIPMRGLPDGDRSNQFLAFLTPKNRVGLVLIVKPQLFLVLSFCFALQSDRKWKDVYHIVPLPQSSIQLFLLQATSDTPVIASTRSELAMNMWSPVAQIWVLNSCSWFFQLPRHVRSDLIIWMNHILPVMEVY